MAQVNGIIAEDAKRRAVLAFQKAMAGNVTQAGMTGADDVTPAAGSLPSAAEGVRAGTEETRRGKKIAVSSAAARAPEAAAGSQGAFRSPPSAPSGNTHKKGMPEPEIPESRKTKPNRKENEFMMNLMILRNSLHRNAPECRERARLAGKYVWRDMRLMMRLVDKIQDALLRTMPASRDEYYSAYARHGHYELHIDGPVRTARHLLVTDKHLAAMAEAAMKSECILCMREGSEIDRCGLREALLESAVPTNIEDGDSMFRRCEYRDAAGQLVQGKDVTV